MSTVYVTRVPGVAVAALAMAWMLSLGSSTDTVDMQPDVSGVGQLLPAAVDTTELVSVLSLRPDVFTVAVYVMVTRAPTARSPVHVRVEPAKLRAPLGPDGVTSAT